MDKELIYKRAKLVRENEKFSQSVITALREIAEEKEQTKSQEDILAEEVFIENLHQIKIQLYFQNGMMNRGKTRL